MNGLAYLIQVNLYLVLFYGLYILLLRNETFFKMNRIFLVGSALISMVIPLMRAEWIKEFFVTERVKGYSETFTTIVNQQDFIEASSPQNPGSFQVHESSFVLADWLVIVYMGVTLLLLLNFLRKLYVVNQLLKVGNSGKAFSFFKKIAIDEKIEGKDTIMEHELVHVKQWHSADVIFFEILAVINWFNPIAFAYKKSIRNIHEYIADENTATLINDKAAYALLLVSNSFNTQPEHLTNNFFNQTLLKRRLIMLNKNKSKKVAILKYGLAVPLFAAMVIFSSATAAGKKVIDQIVERTSPDFESLSNVDLKGTEETASRSLEVKAARKVATKVKAEDLATEEKAGDDQSNSSKAVEVSDNTKKGGLINDDPMKNLLKYMRKFFSGKGDTFYMDGLVYYSFEVSKDKKATNFSVLKSTKPDWGNELLTHLKLFKDTVNLAEGTYSFYKEIIYRGGTNDDLPTPRLAKDLKFEAPANLIYGESINLPYIYTIEDETKKEAGRFVDYIRVHNLKNPIILVGGKAISYTVTDKGFKLDDAIYPKKAEIKVYKGDMAVANYDETARNGLIVVNTSEQD